MKKILFVTPRIPNPQKMAGGDDIFISLINYLSKFYIIDIISRVIPTDNPVWISNKTNKQVFIYKYKSSYILIRKIQNVISWIKFYQLVNKYSKHKVYKYVHFEWVDSILFANIPKSLFTILDTHDVKYLLMERKSEHSTNPLKKISSKFLKYFELKALEKANLVLVKSEFDKQQFLQSNNHLEIKLLTCPLKQELIDNKWDINKSRKEILFVGDMTREINNQAIIQFYYRIWPHLRIDKKYLLKIVGSSPADELIRISKNDSRVILTGFVKDLIQVYSEARVFIAPQLIGGGIIVKVLDALTFGIPTVCTTFSNQGLGAENGKDLLVTDDPLQFANNIQTLINDPELCSKLSASGRKYVLNKFNFQKELDDIYQPIVK